MRDLSGLQATQSSIPHRNNYLQTCRLSFVGHSTPGRQQKLVSVGFSGGTRVLFTKVQVVAQLLLDTVTG